MSSRVDEREAFNYATHARERNVAGDYDTKKMILKAACSNF
jgi:hypothetical protein